MLSGTVDRLLESGKRVSNGWYCRFMERQPQLTLCRGDPIASVHMECTSKEVMEEYFKLLNLHLQNTIYLMNQAESTT